MRDRWDQTMKPLNPLRSAQRKSNGSASKKIIRIKETPLDDYKVITTRGLIYINNKYDNGRYFKD